MPFPDDILPDDEPIIDADQGEAPQVEQPLQQPTPEPDATFDELSNLTAAEFERNNQPPTAELPPEESEAPTRSHDVEAIRESQQPQLKPQAQATPRQQQAQENREAFEGLKQRTKSEFERKRGTPPPTLKDYMAQRHEDAAAVSTEAPEEPEIEQDESIPQWERLFATQQSLSSTMGDMLVDHEQAMSETLRSLESSRF